MSNTDDHYNEADFDRQTLRVEFSPTDRRTPTESIFLLGRLCNELRYQLQVAWLMARYTDPERVELLWGDLDLLLDEFDESVRGENSLGSALQSARNSWECSFNAAPHANILDEANTILSNQYELCVELPSDFNEERVFEETAFSTLDVSEPFIAELYTALSQDQKKVFTLALHADQAINPLLIRRAVQFTSFPAIVDGEGWRASPIRREQWLPCQSVDTKSHWPDQAWFRKYALLYSHVFTVGPSWFGTQYPPPPLPAIFDGIYPQLRDLEAVNQEPCEDRDQQREVIDANTPAAQRGVDHFGLTISTWNQEVTRVVRNFSINVRLSRRLFNLLLHFLERCDQPTSRDWFCQHWRRIGRADTCRPNTVDAAIHDLNNELERISLSVTHASTGQGWILEELGVETP